MHWMHIWHRMHKRHRMHNYQVLPSERTFARLGVHLGSEHIFRLLGCVRIATALWDPIPMIREYSHELKLSGHFVLLFLLCFVQLCFVVQFLCLLVCQKKKKKKNLIVMLFLRVVSSCSFFV